MAQTPEGRVKDAIKKFLAVSGAWFCMPATGGYGKSGVPDFLVCNPVLVTAEHVGTVMGQFIGIEAKAAGRRGDVHPLQVIQLAEIEQRGGRSLVCDDVSQLANVFGPHPVQGVVA